MDLKKLVLSVLRHGGNYALSGGGIILLNLISTPLYTRFFPPREFGIYFTLMSLSQLLMIPFTLCLDASLGRFYYDHAKDEGRFQMFVSTYLIFALIWGAANFILWSCLSPFLFKSSLQVSYFPFILLMLMVTGLQSLVLFLVNILQMGMKSKFLGTLNFLNALLIVILTVALVRFCHWGIEARLVSQIIANTLFFITVLAHLIRSRALKLGFDWKILKSGLKFSLPIIPNTGTGWISNLSDRLLLQFYNMTAAAGIYSIGYDLMRTCISFLGDSTFQVYGPVFFREMTHDSAQFHRRHTRFFTYYLLLMAGAAFTVSIFAKEIIRLLTPKSYADASLIMPIIAYAFLVATLYKPFILVIGFVKKTYLFTVLGCASAFTNLGLNLLLIPRFGSQAAAWTTLAAMSVYTGLAFFFAQRGIKMEYEYARIAKIIGVNLACYGVYILAARQHPAEAYFFLYKVLCVSLFPLGLWALGFFNDKELYFLRKVRNYRQLPSLVQRYRYEMKNL